MALKEELPTLSLLTSLGLAKLEAGFRPGNGWWATLNFQGQGPNIRVQKGVSASDALLGLEHAASEHLKEQHKLNEENFAE